MKLIEIINIIIPIKDTGNGTKKEIVSDIAKYILIHFRLSERNRLSFVFIYFSSQRLTPFLYVLYLTTVNEKLIPWYAIRDEQRGREWSPSISFL